MLEFCRIHAGSTDRGVGGQVLGVANKFDHPNYNPKTYDSDISVLILQGSLVYTPEVQQGDIVAPGVELPDEFPVTQAGWGAIEYLNDPSPVLLEPTAYTISRQLCAERYLTIPNAPTVTDNTICSGLLDVGSRDACNGDSGGPMYLGNIIVGIVSWSYQCADAFYPGVSTAVSPFTNWILETVEGTRRI